MVILCLTTSLISLGLTLYSYLTTRIDLLNFRLLLPFYFFFFSSIIFSTQSNKKFKNTILIIILSLSIIINFSSILINHYNSWSSNNYPSDNLKITIILQYMALNWRRCFLFSKKSLNHNWKCSFHFLILHLWYIIKWVQKFRLNESYHGRH